jgi:hypothetical protein
MLWNKDEVIKWLDKKDWIFEIKEVKEKDIRSKAQNRFYWGYLIPIICDYHWYSEAETHELIKAMFSLETTTDLSTDEFVFMIKSIQDLWKTKFWVVIPDPKDIMEEQSLFKSLWF